MKTIYLNHAGTSWPKPKPVQEAVQHAILSDPIRWREDFLRDHVTICDYFHIPETDHLLLTPGCTSAISTAIEDQPWKAGDRAITSHFEHHALRRPLEKLSRRGIELVTLPPSEQDLVDLDELKRELVRGDVRLVAMTAACNVTGQMLPIRQIIDLCHEHSVTTLIDAAQIVGWLDLDIPALGADLVAFGAHKGMQAPWGIGGLYMAPEATLECLNASCELPNPESRVRPSYCDVGSVDQVALAGWAAAIQWLELSERKDRWKTAQWQIRQFFDALGVFDEVRMHGAEDHEEKIPSLAFQFGERPSTEIATLLAERGVLVGSGLQCAPIAHRALGTERTGVVRLSVGPSTSDEDVALAIVIIQEVLSELRTRNK